MLRKILGPINEEEYFTHYWNKKCLILSSDINNYLSFKKEDFFSIIETCNLEFPRLTCMHDRGQVPIDQYLDITHSSVSAKIISDKVLNLAEKGNTVRVRGINQFNNSISMLKKEMIKTFQFNVTINAYYSSSPANGINPHYDIRHIFIVQLEGTKEWSIGDKINQTPRHDFRPFEELKNYRALKTFNLNAGEILYIPPGLWHKTNTIEPNYSLHLALGITMPDWYDMFNVYMIFLMKKYPIFREHVPFTVEDGKLHFKENLEKDILHLITLLKNEASSYNFYKDIKAEVEKKP
jgi:50S ribosomal protein L16 3-hydroxylase